MSANKASPPIELERHIMDSRVPKSEAEWWAKREIERLTAEIERLTENQEHLHRDLTSRLRSAHANLEQALSSGLNWHEAWAGEKLSRDKAEAELKQTRADLSYAYHTIFYETYGLHEMRPEYDIKTVRRRANEFMDQLFSKTRSDPG